MNATMTALKVGNEVRREYAIPAKLLGLPPGSPSRIAYDLGTVVETSENRVRVYWHTYRADLPAGVCTIKPKRTWVKTSVVRAA